jgi:hypothetical protein
MLSKTQNTNTDTRAQRMLLEAPDPTITIPGTLRALPTVLRFNCCVLRSCIHHVASSFDRSIDDDLRRVRVCAGGVPLVGIDLGIGVLKQNIEVSCFVVVSSSSMYHDIELKRAKPNSE